MVTAARIKEVRTALGETQAQFAARFGVNQGTIAKWENEDVGPPIVGPAAILLEQVLAKLNGKRKRI